MAKKTTSTGATVTTTKATSTGAAPKGDMLAQLMTAPVTKEETAPTVALRGGQAVQAVKLVGKVYRTKAAHNLDWWNTINTQAKDGAVSVKALVEAKVPTHFIGYCVRRGYLGEATV